MSDDPATHSSDRRVHVFKKVIAREDSRQYMVSTSKAMISAEDVETQARALTCGGDMEDTTVQQVSKDNPCDILAVRKGDKPETKTGEDVACDTRTRGRRLGA